MTQSQLARQLGVGQATIVAWEKGKVPADRVPEVARLTGLHVNELHPGYMPEGYCCKSDEAAA